MPYNPGNYDRSGDYYAQGIMGFGQGIARGLERRKADKEDEKRRLEQIQRMQKIASGLGMSEADIQGASLGELSGFVDSAAIERSNELHKAQMDARRADIEQAVLMRRQNQALNKAFMPMGPQRELTTAQRLAMTGMGTPRGFSTAMDMDSLKAELAEPAWRPQIVGLPGGNQAIMTSKNSAMLVPEKEEEFERRIPYQGPSFKENGVVWTWDDEKGSYKGNVEKNAKIDPVTMSILVSEKILSKKEANEILKTQWIGKGEDERDMSDPDVFFDF